MEARDHEKYGAKLRRAEGVGPGPHALTDQFGPFEGLHANKAGAECSGDIHQYRDFFLVAEMCVTHGECHRAGTGDQDEGHDCNQDQRYVLAEQCQREHFARIGPRISRGHPHTHVTNQKAAENEGVADEEDPHHQLAPRHMEGLFLVRPVLHDALKVPGFYRLFTHGFVLGSKSKTGSKSTSGKKSKNQVYERSANNTSQTNRRKCQYTAHSSTLSLIFSGEVPDHTLNPARVHTHKPPRMCSAWMPVST